MDRCSQICKCSIKVFFACSISLGLSIHKGKDLLICRDQAVKLAPNENFITDLIGLKVVTDEGKEFGTLTDVLQTGANDVYVIESLEGKEYLFPAIPQCILDVNLESQMVTVHILDGLLDL